MDLLSVNPAGRNMKRTAQWIAQAVGGTLEGNDVTISGPVVTDSRHAQPGSLYIARRGENSDGHDYIHAARDKGAIAAIVERHVDVTQPGFSQILVTDSTRALGELAHAHFEELRAANSLDVVAITGSAGKTTTKDMLKQILALDAPTVAPKLSFNNEVGMPLTVLEANDTTRHLVLEMGASGAGHIAYLTDIVAPDVAIELMVGHAHLGGFGSVEKVAEAKAELIDGARPGARVILNSDDPYVARMAERCTGDVLRFSTNDTTEADIHAHNITIDDFGRPSFTLVTPQGQGDVHLNFVGMHNVHNALAAAAGALSVGMRVETIIRGLNSARVLSPHRMNIVHSVIDTHPVTIIDDAYNANLDSMRAGFDVLSRVEAPHKIAVVSQMLELGEASVATHREVGAMARDAGVSTMIGLGYDAEHYLEGAGADVTGYHVNSADEAVQHVRNHIDDGCVIFVKGSHGSHAWQVADILCELGALGEAQ